MYSTSCGALSSEPPPLTGMYLRCVVLLGLNTSKRLQLSSFLLDPSPSTIPWLPSSWETAQMSCQYGLDEVHILCLRVASRALYWVPCYETILHRTTAPKAQNQSYTYLLCCRRFDPCKLQGLDKGTCQTQYQWAVLHICLFQHLPASLVHGVST